MKIVNANTPASKKTPSSPSMQDGLELTDVEETTSQRIKRLQEQGVARTPKDDKQSKSAPGKPARVDLKESSSLSTKPIEVVARETSSLGPEWVRQDFPSRGLTYASDIFVRPITIPIMSKIAAAQKTNNFTMLVDALSACISIDVRQLTPSDWAFFMYWLRLNSFPRSPMTIDWTSRYGNTCQYKVTATELEIVDIKMTPAEYKSWLDRGICIPTVRDMEVMNVEGIPDDEHWQIELAQYVVATDLSPKGYVQSKVDALIEMGPDALLDIQEFISLIEHGVVERAKVTDNKFEPEAAIAYLEATADDLAHTVQIMVDNNATENTEISLIGIINKAKEMRETAAAMQDKLAKGLPIYPEEEVIALSINTMSFFPTLRQRLHP